MTNPHDEIWAAIAIHVEPNPLVYTRIAHVCRSARVVFSSDRLWKPLTPVPVLNRLMASFYDRLLALDAKSQQNVRLLWQKLIDFDFWSFDGALPPCPTDPDVGLPWVVLKGTKQFRSVDWEIEVLDGDDFDDEDEDEEDEADDDAVEPEAGSLANCSLFSSFEFCLAAVTLWGPLLAYCQPSQRLAQAAVSCSASLRLTAPETDGHALRFAPGFNAHLDIVRAAIMSDPLSFEFASADLRNRADVVLPLARIDGAVLAFASQSIRANKAIVLDAVTNSGKGLAYASNSLKGDREVVLASVQIRGTSLRDAVPRMRIDDEIIAAAIANDPAAAAFVPEDIDELREVLGVKYLPKK